MKTGNSKVYIIGAGPGDPELISVKAMRAIEKADCVLYDFLSSAELLRHAKKSAAKICVGKSDGLHIKEQSEINRLIYASSCKYGCVVRLKGGDPFIFSRGIEEALYLKKKGVDFEVIPGITSAFAAPESFGIPLTRKGRCSSVAILTGRKSGGESLDAPDCDTLIYLMAVANIKNVIKVILKSGRPKDMPCAFIENATRKGARIVAGNLGNIESRAKEARVRPPAVFIVGDVVKCGKMIYGHKYKNR